MFIQMIICSVRFEVSLWLIYIIDLLSSTAASGNYHLFVSSDDDFVLFVVEHAGRPQFGGHTAWPRDALVSQTHQALQDGVVGGIVFPRDGRPTATGAVVGVELLRVDDPLTPAYRVEVDVRVVRLAPPSAAAAVCGANDASSSGRRSGSGCQQQRLHLSRELRVLREDDEQRGGAARHR